MRSFVKVSSISAVLLSCTMVSCASETTATLNDAGVEGRTLETSNATSGPGNSNEGRSNGESTTSYGASTHDDSLPALTGSDTSNAGSTSVSTGGASTSTMSVESASDVNPSQGEGATSEADAGGSTSSSGDTQSATEDTDSGEPTEEVVADALVVAPNGEPGSAGTIAEPTTLEGAVSRVGAGQTIYVRAGTYPLNATVSLSISGSEAAPINLRAYPLDDARPLLDFSAMTEDSGNRGLSLSANYWHVYGIDVFKAGDNCMFVSGSNNTIEFSTFSECADTGLQLGNGAANNLVLNCDSFFNADSSLENADGFAAKLDVGSANRFVGCRAWNNLDDGWDGYLRPADNVTTTHENCWAIDNGKLKDGSEGTGDGNGFKTGGSDGKDLSHNASYTGCIAAGNVHDGFDHNSNRGNITITNSAAHNNGTNFNFSSSNIAASLTIKNTLAVGDEGSFNATTTDLANNSWQGAAASEDDFESLDIGLLKSPRNSDGSLPNIEYLKLVAGSALRNAGTDLGAPYAGSAPDIGPFESAE